MKKNYMLLFLLFFLALPLLRAQESRYAVYLTDKDTAHSSYSLEDPGAFLSERALQRRERQGIELDLRDLPVAPRYLDSIRPRVKRIQNRSKWLNLVVIEAPDTTVAELNKKNFVQSTRRIAPVDPPASESPKKGLSDLDTTEKKAAQMAFDSSLYGYTWHQTKMLNGHLLHQAGYQGENMLIAVLDAGFQNVDVLPVFDSLRAFGQIRGTHDFEDHDGSVYEHHQHGTMVLSVMAGNIPGVYRGTAPRADYLLCRTEVTRSEYISEEYNWIAAAEYADSAGADLINSSLGYSTFDDSAQDHSYQEMDGNTTPITRAADLAASRGMMVVSSAGNQGNDPWHYIGAPADADSIITAGAVGPHGDYVSFSSTGPTFDERIKPEVAAQGLMTAVQNVDSSFVAGSGTSFSAPIITGLTACLWQKFRQRTPMEIREKILRSASQYQNPDSLTGYGIPNFSASAQLSLEKLGQKSIRVYPIPFKSHFFIDLPLSPKKEQTLTIEIYDMMGRKIYLNRYTGMIPTGRIRIDSLSNRSPGIYLLQLSIDQQILLKKKLLKQ